MTKGWEFITQLTFCSHIHINVLLLAQKPQIKLCLENHVGLSMNERSENSSVAKSNINYDWPRNSVDSAHIPHIDVAAYKKKSNYSLKLLFEIWSLSPPLVPNLITSSRFIIPAIAVPLPFASLLLFIIIIFRLLFFVFLLFKPLSIGINLIMVNRVFFFLLEWFSNIFRK